MQGAEFIIVVPASPGGTPLPDGKSAVYARLDPESRRLSYTHRVTDATIYPNETWARRDQARYGMPEFARIVQVGGEP